MNLVYNSLISNTLQIELETDLIFFYLYFLSVVQFFLVVMRMLALIISIKE